MSGIEWNSGGKVPKRKQLSRKTLHMANWALEKSCLLILSSHLLSQTSNVLLQVWTCWSSSTSTNYIHSIESTYAFRFRYNVRNFQQLPHQNLVQVILFEINCAIFCTNLQELFCQLISWINWVNSSIFMDNCWISCQVMANMENF